MPEVTAPEVTAPEVTAPEVTAILLAAGKGTRMRSPLAKPLVRVAGVPMLRRLADSLTRAGVTHTVIVVGHQADAVRTEMGEGSSTVLQQPQLGTGHAVALCREAVGDAETVLVFVGDSPLVRPSTVRSLVEHHREKGASCTFLTARFPVKFPYARVLRDASGRVLGCVEERRATDDQLAIRELLTSHYAFHGPDLWSFLDRIGPHPDTGETYITDIIAALVDAGRRVEALPIDDWTELVGLNTPDDVAWAEGILEGRDG